MDVKWILVVAAVLAVVGPTSAVFRSFKSHFISNQGSSEETTLKKEVTSQQSPPEATDTDTDRSSDSDGENTTGRRRHGLKRLFHGSKSSNPSDKPVPSKHSAEAVTSVPGSSPDQETGFESDKPSVHPPLMSVPNQDPNPQDTNTLESSEINRQSPPQGPNTLHPGPASAPPTNSNNQDTNMLEGSEVNRPSPSQGPNTLHPGPASAPPTNSNNQDTNTLESSEINRPSPPQGPNTLASTGSIITQGVRVQPKTQNIPKAPNISSKESTTWSSSSSQFSSESSSDFLVGSSPEVSSSSWVTSERSSSHGSPTDNSPHERSPHRGQSPQLQLADNNLPRRSATTAHQQAMNSDHSRRQTHVDGYNKTNVLLQNPPRTINSGSWNQYPQPLSQQTAHFPNQQSNPHYVPQIHQFTFNINLQNPPETAVNLPAPVPERYHSFSSPPSSARPIYLESFTESPEDVSTPPPSIQSPLSSLPTTVQALIEEKIDETEKRLSDIETNLAKNANEMKELKRENNALKSRVAALEKNLNKEDQGSAKKVAENRKQTHYRRGGWKTVGKLIHGNPAKR